MKYFWFHIFHKEIGNRGDRGIRETADQANRAETFKKTSAIMMIITCNAAQTDDWG